MSVYQQLNDTLATLPPYVTCLVVAGFAALETSTLLGFLLPVESVLLAAGWLAHQNAIALAALLLTAPVGALAGDLLGFTRGRRHGSAPHLRRRAAISRVHWVRAERALAGRGRWNILPARFVPFLRTVLPRVAGASGLPFRQYLRLDAIAVAAWTTTSLLLGYAGSASLESLAPRVGVLPAAALLLVAVVLALAVRHRRRRAPGRADVGGRSGSGPTTSGPGGDDRFRSTVKGGAAREFCSQR